MKHFLMSTVAAGMALSLLGAPLAMAENGPQGGQHAASHGSQHAETHGGPAASHPASQHTQMAAHSTQKHVAPQHEATNRTPATRQPTQMAHSQNRPPAPVQHAAMSGGHEWRSGDHYSGNRNYVSNWSQYHLRQPPQGYQWVQDGSQFVLIAVASGVITDVILNSSY